MPSTRPRARPYQRAAVRIIDSRQRAWLGAYGGTSAVSVLGAVLPLSRVQDPGKGLQGGSRQLRVTCRHGGNAPESGCQRHEPGHLRFIDRGGKLLLVGGWGEHTLAPGNNVDFTRASSASSVTTESATRCGCSWYRVWTTASARSTSTPTRIVSIAWPSSRPGNLPARLPIASS